MLRFPRALPDRPLRRRTNSSSARRRICVSSARSAARSSRELKYGVAVVGGGFAGVMAAWRAQPAWRESDRLRSAQRSGWTRPQQPDIGSEGRITEEGAELIGSFHTTWLELAREIWPRRGQQNGLGSLSPGRPGRQTHAGPAPVHVRVREAQRGNGKEDPAPARPARHEHPRPVPSVATAQAAEEFTTECRSRTPFRSFAQ